MIRIEGLTKRFGTRVVLDDVSVELARGAVTAITGPSGCGKSTLLRCINGLETFDAGRILVGDLEVTRDPARLQQVRREVGMVFQQYSLFAHLTALANVMEAPVQVRRLPKAEAKERALRLLEQVGLAHRSGAYPRELSGGEQQRVAIARALAMDPRALLLDEPTAALDPDRKAEVMDVLRTLAEDGVTMVIVTHEPAVVSGIATRVFELAAAKHS
ncbi:MAG: transporter related [Labilithrix sp.]|nr:transporter related [Labilithrix sp.]